MLIGIITTITYIIILLFNLLFGSKKPNIIPIIIGVALSILGTFMFIGMILNINYIDAYRAKETPNTKYEELETTNNILISGAEITKQSDNTKKDGNLEIEIKYNKKYQEITINKQDDYQINNCDYDYDETYEDENENYNLCKEKSKYDYITINSQSKNDFLTTKQIYNEIINNLKENKFYNYSKLFDIKVKVIANDNTLNKITEY